MATRFDTVELNGTFYSLVTPRIVDAWTRGRVDAWRARVPPGFLFAVKASRYVTHMKRLGGGASPVANFFAQGILRLGASRGPVLWQLPPNLPFSPERARGFLELLPRDVRAAERLARQHDERLDRRCALQAPDGREARMRHAFEVRHESWLGDEALELLHEYDVALVAADTAGKHPAPVDRTASFAYVRLHGSRDRPDRYAAGSRKAGATARGASRGGGPTWYATRTRRAHGGRPIRARAGSELVPPSSGGFVLRRFDPDRLDQRDAGLVARVLPVAQAFSHTYCRLCVDGLENIPAGPVIFAANHNGGIAGPDLACTLSTLWRALGPQAPLYALAHDFVMRHFTLVGRAIQRLGAVRASRANADRILGEGASFLVYPGGDLEAYRHARRRDEVVLGERTGFIRAAQRARAPVVPIVAHGAHRSAYIFHEGERLARSLRLKRWARLERFPLALALPWGLAPGPWLPYAPLPFAIRLRVLSAERVGQEADPAVAREGLRARMQHALDAMAREAET